MSAPHILIYDSSDAVGGALTSIVHLLPCLLARGWRVSIWTASHTCEAFLTRELSPLPEGVSVASFAEHGGCSWQVSTARGARYFAREMKRASKLARFISRAHPDVILANNAPQANAAVHLLPSWCEVPVIQYVRGAFYASGLARALLSKAAHVLTVGNEQKERVIALGRPDAKSVGEGLSSKRWPSPRRAGEERWFWASSLMPWKGSDLLLEAYAMLETAPPVDVCYLPVPGQSASRLRSERRFQLHRAPEELDRIRAGASLYIHTALEPEPFGRSILEAMAAGLCPVVPDEGSGPMLVEHGRSGLLYKARDARALASALDYAQHHPEHVARMGRRAMAEARFLGRCDRAFAPVLAALSECIEPRQRARRLARNETVERANPRVQIVASTLDRLAIEGFARSWHRPCERGSSRF